MHAWESRIVARFTEHLIYYPKEVWTLELDDNSMGGDAILDELRTIAFLDGALEIPASHVLRSSESQTNWGASGSFAEYLIEVSVNLAGGAGAAGLGVVVKSVFDRIQKRSSQERDPLTTEQARSLVKAHIALHYGIQTDSLVEKKSMHSLSDGVKEFTFASQDGVEFGGAIGGSDPARCTRVWSSNPSPVLRPEYSHISTDE
ncbi:hypothetical protein [Streptomyces lydicus]|uniref:hypothetical protein n=1 Tax=Streptomyces lydicus TaxID=47763 RepID=UPI00131D121D|nr:hypothetical protein [Streptomyces lydicus]